MSVLLKLVGNADVKSAILCNSAGLLLEAIGDEDAEQLSATMGFLAHHLNKNGSALSLGTFTKLVVPAHHLLVEYRDDAILALFLSDDNALQTVESRLARRRELLDDKEEPAQPETPKSTSRKTPPPKKSQLAPQVFEEYRRAIKGYVEAGKDINKLVEANTSRVDRWLAMSDARVVEMLAHGDETEAEEIIGLASMLLVAREKFPGATLNREAYRRSMDAVMSGIRTTKIGDYKGSLPYFREVIEDESAQKAHRWMAMYWSAKTQMDSGEVESALKEVQPMLDIAKALDDLTFSFYTHLSVGTFLLLGGVPQDADKHADEAIELAYNDRMTAEALLLKANVLVEIGQQDQATVLAEQAQDKDPTWIEPCNFLVKQALRQNKLWQASSLLYSMTDVKDPASQRDLHRGRYALNAIQSGTVSNEGVLESLVLADASATDETISRLEAVVERYPAYLPAKETLAWKLLNRGRRQQANEVFKALAANEMPVFIDSSVKLGLSCIAIAQDGRARQESRMQAVKGQGGRGGAGPLTTNEFTAATPTGVFAGELRHFPLPDLLEFFALRRRTGTLVLNIEKGAGAICLAQGRITAATSPSTDSLGKLLVKAGKLTSEQLSEVLGLQSEDPDRLTGALLIQKGFLDEQTVRKFLTQQILSSVRELIENHDGDFAFEPSKGEPDAADELDIGLDTQFVLLEIFRIIDEESA